MLARAYMDDRTPVGTKLTIAILSLVYVINPVDVLPEILPLLGIVDDAMIIPLLMWILIPNSVLNDARTYIAQEDKKKPKKKHWFFWGVMLCILLAIIALVIYLR